MLESNGRDQASAVADGAERSVGAEMPPAQPAVALETVSLRECARLAALQTELRLLGDLTSMQTVENLQPYLALQAPGVSPATLMRSRQDARFRLPASQLEQIMAHFGAELETPANSPSLLIVVAHQDDETIGAGAQLARLDDVTVLHVTDGAPRDPSYAQRFGYATASEYGEARRREAAEALRLAGVPQERQLCLGIPDGEAPYHLVDLSLTLAEVIEELKPDALLTHPYEGGHTDHDAIAFAVHLACGILRREGTPTPVVLELTSYHNRGGQRVVHEFLPQSTPAGVRTLQLSKQAAELKARMYECFRTQQRCLQQFSPGLERFRAAPRYIFTRPPHEGTLDYERYTRRMTGRAWRAQAQRALTQLRTRKHGRISMAGIMASGIDTSTTTGTSSTVDTQFVMQMQG